MVRGDWAQHFTVAPLTGERKSIDHQAYVETAQGYWLARGPHHHHPPGAAAGGAEARREVDRHQPEEPDPGCLPGETPVYATLVSSGRRDLKERAKDHQTHNGSFRIREKHIAATMDADTATDGPYFIQDVPWIQYFNGSIALHGAFWHAEFGHTKSHGCVNLSPWDAKALFGWTDSADTPRAGTASMRRRSSPVRSSSCTTRKSRSISTTKTRRTPRLPEGRLASWSLTGALPLGKKPHSVQSISSRLTSIAVGTSPKRVMRAVRTRARAGLSSSIPKSPEVHNLLGYTAAIAGDAEDALEHYRHAIALDETYFEAMLNAAEVLMHPIGEFDAAVEMCDEALDYAETHEEIADCVLLKVDALIGKGEMDEARRGDATVPDGPFDNASYTFLIGRAFTRRGRLREGLAAHRGGGKKDPATATRSTTSASSATSAATRAAPPRRFSGRAGWTSARAAVVVALSGDVRQRGRDRGGEAGRGPRAIRTRGRGVRGRRPRRGAGR